MISKKYRYNICKTYQNDGMLRQKLICVVGFVIIVIGYLNLFKNSSILFDIPFLREAKNTKEKIA